MNWSEECSCVGRSAITRIESQFHLIGYNRRSVLKHQVKYGKLRCKPYGLGLLLKGCIDLSAHTTSGAGADGAGGGFLAFKGEVVFLLQEGLFDAVVDEIPRECFIQIFGPVYEKIRIDF